MPFTRISLHGGKPTEYLRALSDSLHQAMVDSFEVPPADRFQVFHQHAPGELVYDRDYLGGPRGEDFVLIAITAGKPRSTNTKQRFYRRLAECLAESPGIAPRDVMVVITPTQAEDWSFANGVALVDAVKV
ncbi:tautomerase family protein [Roseateles sp.]|uniref:tautomerase family protein n=1 Tax=Roseateles sp. TaxID=1971397 RepID=UPI0032664892